MEQVITNFSLKFVSQMMEKRKILRMKEKKKKIPDKIGLPMHIH